MLCPADRADGLADAAEFAQDSHTWPASGRDAAVLRLLLPAVVFSYRGWLRWGLNGHAKAALDIAAAETPGCGRRRRVSTSNRNDQDLLELVYSDAAMERQGRALKEISALTAREFQVLMHVVKGLDNGAISRALHLSLGTVKDYVSRIFAQLGCANRVQAALMAYDAAIALGRDQLPLGQASPPFSSTTKESVAPMTATISREPTGP